MKFQEFLTEMAKARPTLLDELLKLENLREVLKKFDLAFHYQDDNFLIIRTSKPLFEDNSFFKFLNYCFTNLIAKDTDTLHFLENGRSLAFNEGQRLIQYLVIGNKVIYLIGKRQPFINEEEFSEHQLVFTKYSVKDINVYIPNKKFDRDTGLNSLKVFELPELQPDTKANVDTNKFQKLVSGSNAPVEKIMSIVNRALQTIDFDRDDVDDDNMLGEMFWSIFNYGKFDLVKASIEAMSKAKYKPTGYTESSHTVIQHLFRNYRLNDNERYQLLDILGKSWGNWPTKHYYDILKLKRYLENERFIRSLSLSEFISSFSEAVGMLIYQQKLDEIGAFEIRKTNALAKYFPKDLMKFNLIGLMMRILIINDKLDIVEYLFKKFNSYFKYYSIDANILMVLLPLGLNDPRILELIKRFINSILKNMLWNMF